MKRFLSILLLLIAAFLLNPREGRAQTPDHDAVFATLQSFFEGFAEQDSTKMFKYSDRNGRLVLTSSGPNGEPVMRTYAVEEFVGILMRPREQPIRETISNPEIRIVDNLAAAWVDYNLWVGDQIDHCGVDHFQLFRSSDGWIIVATADTQQRTGCVPFE